MAYHDDVEMIVKEARKLREFAANIQVTILAFNERLEEVEAKARACKYPIREARALMPSIKAKIVIPEPVNITPAPVRDEYLDLTDTPAHMRRT